MKTDIQGVSQCPPGSEQWEEYADSLLSRGRNKLPVMRVQYDYRTPDGQLFSTIAPTLEIARKRRDDWLGKAKP